MGQRLILFVLRGLGVIRVSALVLTLSSCEPGHIGEETAASADAEEGNTTNSDGCSSSCTTEVVPPVYGDGLMSGTETLDGTNFGEETAAAADAGVGNTANNDGCSSSCTADVAPPVCGDGLINGTETCDGTNFGGKTCVSETGQAFGTLLCDSCSISAENCDDSLPAYSANLPDTEYRCDSLGQGETCVCNELLIVNDGELPLGSNLNPSGSTSRECNNGTAITQLSNGRADFRTPAELAPDSALPNVPYVFRGIAGNRTQTLKGIQNDYDFTNNTICTRTYVMYEGGNTWSCPTNGCNVKGPRYTKGSAQHPGFESAWGSNSDYLQFAHCTFDGAQDIGHCGYHTSGHQCDIGCGNLGKLSRNISGLGGSDIHFSEWRGEWLRTEICFDHNPDGDDYLWARVRQTLVTGPNTGNVQYYGPGRGVTPVPSASIGTNNNLWSTFIAGGSPDPNSGDRFVSYGIVMTKSTADPSWWIGPACEIEPNTPECQDFTAPSL